MAGRRERQKQEREARILRAAESLFVRRGFAATAMHDIAKRAGLAVGTLYNYFASKPQILLAIVERDTVEGLTAGERVVKDPPADPVAAIQQLLELELDAYTGHERALWRELVGAAVLEPSLARSVIGSDIRLVGLLASLLRELSARGRLPDDLDAGRGAIALYGAFFTWFIVYVTSDDLDIADVRRELRASVAVIANGLLSRAPRGRGTEP